MHKGHEQSVLLLGDVVKPIITITQIGAKKEKKNATHGTESKTKITLFSCRVQIRVSWLTTFLRSSIDCVVLYTLCMTLFVSEPIKQHCDIIRTSEGIFYHFSNSK